MWAATFQEEISDPFLFMNDDFFFTRTVYLPEFPLYHEGDLRGKLVNPFHDERTILLQRCGGFCGIILWSPLNPIPIRSCSASFGG
ncbi:MAG: hypothetical protein ACUVQS_01955 [Candidatus Bipolaricaulaceae bacterium]